MKKVFLLVFFLGSFFNLISQFAPRAGQPGTTAIHRDSSVFVNWATGCSVQRGYRNISTHDSGYASAGTEQLATGKPGNGVVSLGDSGVAVLTFEHPIRNGAGWDFAVFENSFSDTFLELAFVEVSSDGINYFRFPATSLTQDSVPLGPFGFIEPRDINNLAGKYRALYGTPFDLEELKDIPGLDVEHITHVKIVDVVGTLNDSFAGRDSEGRKINDPWPTPFESCGFDLDAVGVIHQYNPSSIHASTHDIYAFPNPATVNESITIKGVSEASEVFVYDLQGRKVFACDNVIDECVYVPTNFLATGLYQILIVRGHEKFTIKLAVVND